MTKSLDEVVLRCVGTDEFCHRRQAIQDRIKTFGYGVCVSRMLVETDRNKSDNAPRPDSILDLYESGEEVRGKVTKVEQFIASGGMHTPNETQDQRPREAEMTFANNKG